MKLPDATTRAILRLTNPAQRFIWACEQLDAALEPTPAVTVNAGAGIAAKAVGKGAIPPFMEIASYMYLQDSSDGLATEVYLILPVNQPQYVRGQSLLKSIGELSLDVVPPYVGVLPSGSPVLDNSVATTIEQYAYEQLLLMISANGGSTGNNKFQVEKSYITLGEYTERAVSSVKIFGKVARAGRIGNNRYGDITGMFIE